MALEATPRLIAIGETMMMFTPAGAESLATVEEVRLHPGAAADARGSMSNVSSSAR